MCQEKRCSRSRCREIAHHMSAQEYAGLCATIRRQQCPQCKLPFAQLRNPNSPQSVWDYFCDYSHAAGMACYRCGYYWLPEGLPASLAEDMSDWETPLRERSAVAA